MGIFTFLGGDIGNPFRWQSGGSTGTEPGPTDLAIFSAGGSATGSANVEIANFSGAYVFSGANLSAGQETVFSGGSIVQKDGINAIVSAFTTFAVFGSYTLSGGTLAGSSDVEAIAGPFVQAGGTNTVGDDLEIGGATYTLSGGTLAIASGLDGNEFVGFNNASGGFIQSGGTHVIARFLQIGSQGSGTYVLSAGLLSMPVSGPFAFEGFGEFIGENSGGVGTFIQSGGTNSVADRIVIGTTNLFGVANASGTYVLGGSGVLDVNTLFVGSEQGCSGTFDFNTAKGDNAQLTASGIDPFFAAVIVGGDGIGTFVQGGVFGTSVDNGGTVSAASLQVGRHFDGVGEYILSTGVLQISSGGYETIGGFGSGAFEQTFGSNTVGGTLFIGSSSEQDGVFGSGLYDLKGPSTLTVSQGAVLGVSSGTIGTLNIDSAGTGAVVIVSATDSATALTVGSGGSGRLNQFGGSVTLIGSGSAPVLDIAAQSGGDGIYNMSGGTLAVIAGGSTGSAGPAIVGDFGSGDFNQTSGAVTLGGNLVVGNGSGGDGTVFLQGDSKTTLQVSGNIAIGAQQSAFGIFEFDEQKAQATLLLGSRTILTVGGAGSGTFVQGGGSLSAFGLDIGSQTTGSGLFNLSGGTLLVSAASSGGPVIVGDAGSGTFVQSGGIVSAFGLDIGAQTTGSGLFNISGGTLLVSAAGSAIVGDAGSGTYEQVGGTATFGGDVIVGAAGSGQGGSLSLNGGSNTSLKVSGNIVIARDGNSLGTFNYNTSAGAAAKLTLASSSTVVVGKGGNAVFSQGGGSLTASGLDIGVDANASGRFKLSGGTLAITGGQAIVGDNGIGFFVHNGANATAAFSGGLDIGAHDGTGFYELSAGKLTVGSGNDPSTILTVGDSGSGTFTQTGGTGVFNGGLTIASPFGGTGSFTVSGGADTINGDTVIADAGSGAYTQRGGTAIFSGNVTVGDFTGSGTFALAGGTTIVKGEIDLGAVTNTSGEFDFDVGGGSATLASSPNLKIGVGGTGTLVDGGGALKAGTVAVGTENGGSGLVNVSGAGAAFSMTTLSLGSFPLGSSPTGGAGTLLVSNGGYVSVAKTLTLNDYVSADSNLKETFSGGIYLSGGSVEVGGNKGGVPADTLQIDSGGVLSGHGLITGDNNFKVAIAKSGTLEAKDGLLVISGDVAGSGTIRIDNDATVEIVGVELDRNLTVTFQSGGTGTLILDSPSFFSGTIAGLTDGDRIILTRTGSATTPIPNEVVNATIGSSGSGGQSVFVAEGADIKHVGATFNIPISGPANDPVLTGTATQFPHFFTVSSGGSGTANYTTLTLSSGSPIAQAMGLMQSASGLNNGSLTGAGIKIGIISDSFNIVGGKDAGVGAGAAQTDIKNGQLPSASNIVDLASGKTISGGGHDEGRAMAEIVHAIAPGASIVFQSYRAEPEYGQSAVAAMAHAIRDLQAQHVQIIVDDVGLGGEPDRGGLTNVAINNAVMSGVSYFTAAGNFRLGGPLGVRPIFGHQTNPNAVTVAAINYLASFDPPALTPAYLQTATEPFSSIGAGNSGKPNITAPDGDPTSFLLPPGSTLDPFFGTSAAAPAAAAVAALMMEINPQLELNPQRLATFMEITAINGGEPFSREGFGLLDGPLAISKAAGAVTTFFDPATSAGPTLLAAAISQPFGSVATGTLVRFQLIFDEPLIITGTPTFTLNDGGTAKYDAAASQPSDATLVFDYSVSSTQHTSDLEITGFNSASGKIADSAGHVPVLSGMFGSSTGLSVNSPVTVTSVTTGQSGQEVHSGDTVHISMTLNHPVSVTSGASGGLTLALDDGGTAFYDSATSTPTTLVFDYVVSGGEQTPNLTVFAVDLASGTTIQSGGFNAVVSAAIGAATDVQVGAAFVTNVVPSQFGDAEPGTSVTLEIDFSQPVSVNTSGGSPTLILNNGGTAFYDAALSSAGSGALVFDYTVSSGQHTPDLEITTVSSGGAVITDSHGTAVDFSAALSAPLGLGTDSPLKVSAVTTSQAVFADTGQTVQLAVSMSEAVLLNTIEAFGLPTLALNDGGIAFYDDSASNLSAGLLAFDYTVSAHDSTTDLKVTALNQNGAAIFDSAGNALDVSTGFPFDVGIGINSFDSWKAGKIGDWSTASNWTSGLPASTTQATILTGGVVSSTAADDPTVGSIATAKGATLKVSGGSFTATLGTGIGVNAGAIVVSNGATLTLGGRFVNSGSIALSGTSSATRLELDGVNISGGKLQTSGASARIETVSGTTDAMNGATIVSGTVVAVVSGSTLSLSGDTIGSAATVSATSGSTAIVSGLVADAGALVLNGVTSVGTSATLETLAGGTALLGGAVTNSGTLFASGAHSLVDILGGAVVTGGGIAKVGNGILNISASGVAEDVVFVAGGTGRLELADNPGDTSAFAGHVSGFGQNVHQFIDLTEVAFTSAVSASYSSSTASSGVLTVTSGGSANVVAVIDFVGHYVTSNFHVISGASGNVAIFDPPTATQLAGSTLPGANLALFANYLAASFPTVIGHGGVLMTDAPEQAGLQPLLTHPRTG